jgi:hypothetical protein
MYKLKKNNQISFEDFDMPNGVELNPENRWVKKSETIPWVDIEIRYAELFKSNCGNVAKPLRLALGSLLIQSEYSSFSDEEVVLQIQENPYMQFFCGFSGYTNEKPFDSSLMVHFRKRLTLEILGEINEMIIANAEKDSDDEPPSNSGDFENRGELIVDSTCAPQNIKYPQDLNLLNEARENLEKMIDKLHDPAEGVKARTYRKQARKYYLKTAKKRKKTAKEIRKAIGKQLNYVMRDFNYIVDYLNNGKTLCDRDMERFEIIRNLFDQQSHMHVNKTHQVNDRIVSLSQPWVRPIVRGKAKSKCEFGAKLDISVSGGFTRLEHTSFDAYNESENLIEIIERFKKRTGHYPEKVLVDQIYRNRDNINFCKKWNIQILGKPLGRPSKDYAPDKKQARQNEIDRIEVERKFSQAKGSHGLRLIKTRLKNTSLTAIALSIVSLNIAQIIRLILWIFVLEKRVVVQ